MAADEKEAPEVDESTTELPPEQETRIVDKVVNKVRSVIDDIIGGKQAPEAEPEVEDKVEETSEPTSIREIENDMEAQVRAAIDKIDKEKQHAADHEKLAKEPERPPRQLSKITQSLWGDRD